jgi:hypothetical protein
MLIGVVSDTHIPVVAKSLPDELLEKLKGVDLIIHAGDLVSLSVIDQLKEIAPVEAVSGNMDSFETRQIFPNKKIIDVGKFKIGITHGGGGGHTAHLRALDAFSNEKVDCIVFGHSHKALNQEYSGILLFNPGSATDRRFSPKTSFGFLEVNDKITGKIVYL